ncbi:MAG: hypothetical protein AAF959_01125 [Cyanobacteria bacterium P01_D01_bin.56]
MLLGHLFTRWLQQDFYLDWRLIHWHKIYKNQTNLITTDCFGSSQSIPQVLAFDNTKKKLNLDQVRVNLSPFKFYSNNDLSIEIAFHLYRLYSLIHGRQMFNSDCLRLRSIEIRHTISSEEFLLLDVQEVSYFDYIKKNLLLDVKFKSKSKSLRERIHIDQNQFALDELHRSQLANILGVNILIFTADGALILNKRSSKTLIRPGELCSSVSGGLNKSDIVGYTDEDYLGTNLLFLFREAFEEIGINSFDLIESQSKFLGITRDLIRGGQPDMFLSAQIKLTQDQALRAYNSVTDKTESSSLFFFDMGLSVSSSFKEMRKQKKCQRRMLELLDTYNDIISLPLLTHLILWYKTFIQ